jgi:hypothetical protein
MESAVHRQNHFEAENLDFLAVEELKTKSQW